MTSNSPVPLPQAQAPGADGDGVERAVRRGKVERGAFARPAAAFIIDLAFGESHVDARSAVRARLRSVCVCFVSSWEPTKRNKCDESGCNTTTVSTPFFFPRPSAARRRAKNHGPARRLPHRRGRYRRPALDSRSHCPHPGQRGRQSGAGAQKAQTRQGRQRTDRCRFRISSLAVRRPGLLRPARDSADQGRGGQTHPGGRVRGRPVGAVRFGRTAQGGAAVGCSLSLDPSPTSPYPPSTYPHPFFFFQPPRHHGPLRRRQDHPPQRPGRPAS